MTELNRYSGAEYRASERPRQLSVTIEADKTVVPCAGEGEIVPVTLAVFPGLNQLAYVGSTIGSREVLVAAASDLDPSESQRINSAMKRILEQLLETGKIKSNGVFSSGTAGKPDIHMFVIGDPWSDSCLRLYCHTGQRNGAPVLYQDGKTRKKVASKVEKAFRSEGGYFPPKSWSNVGTTEKTR